jgi:hypothetical protein
MLFDGKELPGRARLFKKLNTPVDRSEISDIPDFSKPVFRFLSRAVAGIGLSSLLLLIPNPPGAYPIILCFSALTLCVAASLWLVPRGIRSAHKARIAAQHTS